MTFWCLGCRILTFVSAHLLKLAFTPLPKCLAFSTRVQSCGRFASFSEGQTPKQESSLDCEGVVIQSSLSLYVTTPRKTYFMCNHDTCSHGNTHDPHRVLSQAALPLKNRNQFTMFFLDTSIILSSASKTFHIHTFTPLVHWTPHWFLLLSQ